MTAVTKEFRKQRSTLRTGSGGDIAHLVMQAYGRPVLEVGETCWSNVESPASALVSSSPRHKFAIGPFGRKGFYDFPGWNEKL